MTTPHGAVTASYGSFGTSNLGFNLAYGGQKWGNFISANGLNSGRFLDPPEFAVMHDKGNEENLFDRVDYQLSTADSIHVNFGYSRSWFQNPNSFDQQFHNVNGVQLTDPVTGKPLGATDQVSQIKTFNIAPTWTRLLNSAAVFTLGAFVRRDQYNYYPSADPFDDFSPDLQGQTVVQNRKLTNTGLRSNVSYAKGIHNMKVGATYQQTFLDENDGIGIVDPGLVAGIAPSVPQSDWAAYSGYAMRNPGALRFDWRRWGLARGGLFHFNGHTDVKELALYGRDNHERKLVFQPGRAGRFLQRADPRPGRRASSWRCLQH